MSYCQHILTVTAILRLHLLSGDWYLLAKLACPNTPPLGWTRSVFSALGP
jgi:hypothetical protein